MNALASSLGRLPTRRKKEQKKSVVPINVAAAQKFQGSSSFTSPASATPTQATYSNSTQARTPPSAASLLCDIFSLTPPASPSVDQDQPSTPVKSPLRRAFSRTFNFKESPSSPSFSLSRRPSFSSPESAPSGRSSSMSLRRRSRALLLPSLPISEPRTSVSVEGSPSPSRNRSFGDHLTVETASVASNKPKQGSLRSIRSFNSRVGLSSFGSPTTPPNNELSRSGATTPPPAPLAPPKPRKLSRRASDESFQCRGLGYEDTCDSKWMGEPPFATDSTLPGIAAARMSEFTVTGSFPAMGGFLHHELLDLESGLRPEAPRLRHKRLSTASLASDMSIPTSNSDSFHSSISSLNGSELEEAVVNSRTGSSSSFSSISEQWFSSCPPTPPSSIRLQLHFETLPEKPRGVRREGLFGIELSGDSQPIQAIFVSSNSSVLDLKEIIAEKLAIKGYEVSPRQLGLCLHLSDLYCGKQSRRASSALGLAFNEDGASPIKELANNARLLFEEGALEDDVMIVRYLPLESDKYF
ncbi:hypothetical protein IE53DRAFT_383177 [Violaceomyces palustris]|uniref:Uncharacterized protein n=1 Tax=Violaceomyces palustris TaxID=1673888 RepID=A0ACD0P8I9_9BASI|nr:hypothetical protein IE53DRAFT_383177 [Violaceomyces palustris]